MNSAVSTIFGRCLNFFSSDVNNHYTTLPGGAMTLNRIEGIISRWGRSDISDESNCRILFTIKHLDAISDENKKVLCLFLHALDRYSSLKKERKNENWKKSSANGMCSIRQKCS